MKENKGKNCCFDVNQGEGDNLAHNKSMKAEYDNVLGQIGDQETLKSSVNEINVRELSADPANPDVYTVESGSGRLAKIAPIEKSGNPNLEKYPEMDRFAKEHAVESSSVVVGQKSSGLPKSVGKEDIRDSHRGA